MTASLVISWNVPVDQFAVFEQNLVPPMQPLDFVGDCREFFVLAAVDDVWIDRSFQAFVRGHADHIELVNLPELAGFGEGRARHAADLAVELEEVLQRDCSKRLRFLLDRDAFFGFDGLVQTVAPMATRHEAAREFIDDDDFAILDDVVHVAFVEVVGLQRIIDEMRPLHVAGRVETFDAGEPLGFAYALVGQVRGMLFLFDFEVNVFFELASDLVGTRVFCNVIFGRAADDERRAGLVDEDIVDFVDDGEVKRALRLLPILVVVLIIATGGDPHVVAEVVETEFVIRSVGDITGIRLLAFCRLHAGLDVADSESEACVERAHPFHVAAG